LSFENESNLKTNEAYHFTGILMFIMLLTYSVYLDPLHTMLWKQHLQIYFVANGNLQRLKESDVNCPANTLQVRVLLMLW